jgi:hypothetical protein
MATTDNIFSFVAAEAITEFAAVSVNADGKIIITDASTDDSCVGIAQRACSAGDSVEVVIDGVTRAIAGDAIAPETTSLLMAEPNGKLIPLVLGSGNFAIARILPNINHHSPADGDQIKVVFTGPNYTGA